MNDTSMSTPNVYRDEIKEGRMDYFVTYQPADSRFSFALVDLVFPERRIENTRVAQAMEDELEIWLKRYPVPVMVSAFDAKEDLIGVHGDDGESHLMGYRDLKTGQLVRRWGLLKENELPAEQTNAEHLQSAYQGVSFRDQAAVRKAAQRKTTSVIRGARAIIFFIVAVPVLIEIISLGVAWLGYILSTISITAGAYKAGKAFGWLKPTKRELAKAEELRKMEQCYWHCERNPEAFNRLKIQNFERDAMERTRKEADLLGIRRSQE